MALRVDCNEAVANANPAFRGPVKTNLPGGSISCYAHRAGQPNAIGSFGDGRNALLVLTVQATGSRFDGAAMTLPADRPDLLNERIKIKVEQAFFYAVPG